MASDDLKVQCPYLAGQHDPHYSQRTDKWSDGLKDDKIVPLVAPLREVPVVVTAIKPYVAEGNGYMHVHVGDRIQLPKTTFESGEQDNLYSTYAYGYRLKPFAMGCFPVHVLHDGQTQLATAGAHFV